jgi:hypothetical protein
MLYASRTGTKRNLTLMREYGWRLLVSATGVWRNEGFPYAIDNGAWTAFQQGKPFDGARFQGLVTAMGRGADWIVLPDVVGNAVATASITENWLDALDGYRTLAVIQDGAEERVLERLVGHVYGFFLGGSTDYKLANIDRWSLWSKAHAAYFHVGRVNSNKRIRKCALAGVDSVDGTSASRFAVTVAPLTVAKDVATQQRVLWTRLHKRSFS